MQESPLIQSVRRRVQIIGALALAFLLAPICVYIFKFGWNISDNHVRWSEMGSAMSGLYTPILSLLTLWVLAAQVRLQGEMNKHAFDQAYLQEVRSDVQFYVSQIVKELAVELGSGSSIGKELISAFAYPTVKELRGQKYTEIAQSLNRNHPRIMSIWLAFYPLLEGLRSNKHFPYTHNFEAAKQKAIALLSFECCVALDNFVWCVSEERLNLNYEFSPDFKE